MNGPSGWRIEPPEGASNSAVQETGRHLRMAEQWYYSKGGQQHGPINAEGLKQLAATGQLQPSDLVWREGMAAWRRLPRSRGCSSRTLQPPLPVHLKFPPRRLSPLVRCHQHQNGRRVTKAVPNRPSRLLHLRHPLPSGPSSLSRSPKQTRRRSPILESRARSPYGSSSDLGLPVAFFCSAAAGQCSSWPGCRCTWATGNTKQKRLCPRRESPS